MSKDVNKLLKELEGKINELPMHVYIMIWSLSEMSERMQKNEKSPKFIEICYPFTSVPIFLANEATNLEELWRKNISNNTNLFPDQPVKQSGGRSLGQLKKDAAAMGENLNFALKAVDPKLISPDYLYDYTTELLDTIDAKLTQASGNFGVLALENTMPDPNIIIPVTPPIIVPISSKSVFPMINAVLESLRILSGVIFYIDPMGIGSISRTILTLVMVCLDLARGNIYHAIFTSFGFIGNNPMYIGIVLKILRDAIMLVSPDLRTELRNITFKSSKSFITGFAIWLFTTLSPKFVRLPISALFNGVSEVVENINNSFDMTEDKIRLSPIGKLANITFPRIPTDKIPDVNNLYALREAVKEPAIYCDPKIGELIDSLREVPPYALFFDLALIPRKESDDFTTTCKPYAGKDLIENLKKLIEPEIELKELPVPESPIPGIGVNPMNLLQNPQQALQNTVTKSIDPTGTLQATLANPQQALQNTVAKSVDPTGSLQATLANPQQALQNTVAKSVDPTGSLQTTLANPQQALQNKVIGALPVVPKKVSNNRKTLKNNNKPDV